MDSKTASPNLQLRILLLDLIYPAVLGAAIVLIFIRIAKFGSDAWMNCTTYFGLVITIFYSLGYVKIKLLPEERYTWLAALLDLVNSAAIFLSFYVLGFVEEQLPSPSDGTENFALVYLLLIYIFTAPLLSRILVWKDTDELGPRLFLCGIVIAVLIVGALTASGFVAFAIAPHWFAILVGVLVAVYLIDVFSGGMS